MVGRQSSATSPDGDAVRHRPIAVRICPSSCTNIMLLGAGGSHGTSATGSGGKLGGEALSGGGVVVWPGTVPTSRQPPVVASWPDGVRVAEQEAQRLVAFEQQRAIEDEDLVGIRGRRD